MMKKRNLAIVFYKEYSQISVPSLYLNQYNYDRTKTKFHKWLWVSFLIFAKTGYVGVQDET